MTKRIPRHAFPVSPAQSPCDNLATISSPRSVALEHERVFSPKRREITVFKIHCLSAILAFPIYRLP